MAKHLDHKDFILLIKKDRPHIKILNKYTKLEDILKCFCSKHNYYFKTKAFNLYRGTNCPKCAKESQHDKLLKETEIKYKRIIKEKFPFIEALENYRTLKTKIKFKCNNCGNIFISNYDLLNKSKAGCIKCNSVQIIKLEKILKLLKKYHSYISFNTQKYKGVSYKYKFYCSKCNKYFVTMLSNLIYNRSSCPSCSKSSGERIVEAYLNDLNINYKFQHIFKDCKNIRPLRFDYYIPSFNLIIEIMGDQHYKPINLFGGQSYFEKVKKRDKIKKLYCINNNINYMEISYRHLNTNSFKNMILDYLKNKM